MQTFTNQRAVHAIIWISLALALHCAAAAMAQETEEIWKNLDAHARKIHEASDLSYSIRVIDRSGAEPVEFVTNVWTKGENRKWLRIDYPVPGSMITSVVTPKGGWHYHHGNKSIIEVSPSEIRAAAAAGKKMVEDFVAKLPRIDMEAINEKYRGLHELNATDSGDDILFVYRNAITMHRVDLVVDRETGFLTRTVFYADGQNPINETLIENISSGEPDPEVFERPTVIVPFKPEFKPPENRWKPPVAGVAPGSSETDGDGTMVETQTGNVVPHSETQIEDPAVESKPSASPAPTDLLGF